MESYISTKWIIDKYTERLERNKQYVQTTGMTLRELLEDKECFELFAEFLVEV